MNKIHFITIKLKNYILPTIFSVFTICLVIFSSSNLDAAKKGLILWSTSIVPSLFPFFIATELLSKTNIPKLLGKLFNPIMKPLFNIHGEGSFALIMGILSGYPVGAKIACKFRQNNTLSKVECERLLSFTNNSGPLFILGTVGITMFGSSHIGLLLFIIHILACISVGIIFRFWKINQNNNIQDSIYSNNFDKSKISTSKVTFFNLGEVLSESISSATSTIIMIGGFVVLFSVIISILNASRFIILISNIINPVLDIFHIPPSFSSSLITGFLEITNGISQIANIQIKNLSINLIFTSFLLGFGGFSIFLQVLSITSKTDLSIKPYIYGKILHGLLAACYTFIFCHVYHAFII